MAFLNIVIPYRRRKLRSERELISARSARISAEKALANAKRELHMVKWIFGATMSAQLIKLALSYIY